MAGRSSLEDDLSELLEMLKGGSVRIAAEGEILAAVDADQRNVRVDVQPFLQEWRKLLRAAPRDSKTARGATGVPRLLAEEGWQVALYDRDKEVARLGRGTSALTGHIHIDLAAVGLLREIL